MDKILLVDDDKEIRNILMIYLENNDCKVVVAENGQEALDKVDDSFDLILLDIMMPVMDGIEACRKIRDLYTMPIIFLSAKGSDIDKITGLVTGADDYIVKPFNPMEVVARIKANIRRYKILGTKAGVQNQSDGVAKVIRIKNIEIYLDEYKVLKDGMEIKLTRSEYEILKLLLQNRGIVFNADQIYDRIWNDAAAYSGSNSVVVHIKNLREKLEVDHKKPELIINIWGVGYKIEK